ncbi:serine/threonine protein kinase [Micromonospora sp. PLK6-60]|uniref:serine/threonine protein kinase n=1 Tax=Micromonospora sp. PLK6-60 TaxID=2873383 RepID=UPI001CA6E4F3|nr:serine/threonine protein kinase [Micromonospora sp. PLK6-60]MBY8871331.1 serine/threonine protein kinase [Micromonospora sp. PLK6-60]
MGILTVHVPATDGRRPVSLDLEEGERARFGRGAADCPVPIALPDPAVPRTAGEIAATGAYWHLSNLSDHQVLVVENPEGAGEYIRVAPRRLSAPVPFEFSRVVLATRTGTVDFHVYAPGHRYLDAGTAAQASGTATVSPFCLDEQSTYFLVLVALCEPRLRDQSSVAVPTTPQLVRRLREHPRHRTIGAAAVGFHIDYLADTKLRLHGPEHGRRWDWKRETLVSVAVRFGLVTEDHLALLPRSRTAAR